MFAELGAEQQERFGIRQRDDRPQVCQKRSHADGELETRSGTRQHVLAGVRVHERFPVRVVSAARVRTEVQTDDQEVHRIGYEEIRHDQQLLSSHEVRTLTHVYIIIIKYIIITLLSISRLNAAFEYDNIYNMIFVRCVKYKNSIQIWFEFLIGSSEFLTHLSAYFWIKLIIPTNKSRSVFSRCGQLL